MCKALQDRGGFINFMAPLKSSISMGRALTMRPPSTVSSKQGNVECSIQCFLSKFSRLSRIVCADPGVAGIPEVSTAQSRSTYMSNKGQRNRHNKLRFLAVLSFKSRAGINRTVCLLDDPESAEPCREIPCMEQFYANRRLLDAWARSLCGLL